jgi:hypothetical protein
LLDYSAWPRLLQDFVAQFAVSIAPAQQTHQSKKCQAALAVGNLAVPEELQVQQPHRVLMVSAPRAQMPEERVAQAASVQGLAELAQ